PALVDHCFRLPTRCCFSCWSGDVGQRARLSFPTRRSSDLGGSFLCVARISTDIGQIFAAWRELQQIWGEFSTRGADSTDMGRIFAAWRELQQIWGEFTASGADSY